MLELSRTVRFCVNDPPPAKAQARGEAPRDNTFAAWPPMRGLGRYYELDVTCRGQADAQTGYFINIKLIDQAVLKHALPCIHRALTGADGSPDVPIGQLMREMLAALQPALRHSVVCIELGLTPTYKIALRSHDMDHVLIRQRYEFSAAHRLHVPGLSDQENRDIFGKCNNPAGHGHNYRLQVVVRLPIDPDGRTADIEQVDALVNRHAIEQLDHKHLNTDVPQFAGLNPSVENIVKVIWDMLVNQFGPLGPGAALDELSVWETSKTVCTYRGPAEAIPEGIAEPSH
jgi:6-pyruvoyltetrahydropterin/6-carboxytetrahydropterin synthase